MMLHLTKSIILAGSFLRAKLSVNLINKMQEFEERIIPVNIEEEMKTSYIDYSMSVIVSQIGRAHV